MAWPPALPEAKRRSIAAHVANSKPFVTGLYDICPVCFWEDDGQGEAEADEVWGGPNKNLSLRQAQKNFAAIGAVEEAVRRFVRKPQPDEF